MMMDLVYFGYEWESDSRSLEQEYIKEVKEAFPDVQLKNSYDEIKGYRQSVYLDENRKEDYLVWALAFGWFNCSMTLTLLIRQDEEKALELIEKAKEKYPEKFTE